MLEKLSPETMMTRKPLYPIEVAISEIQQQLSTVDEGFAFLPIMATPPGKIGDFGIACHQLAKVASRNPQSIAEEALPHLASGNYIDEYRADGGYINVLLNRERFSQAVVSQIFDMKDRHGSENIGQGMHLVIDMSSPNIAKRMSVGHLRSTIIGDSLARIYSFLGYRVTKDNHIGDWGTQFGHLMHAIDMWGDMDMIAKDPINELGKLYVQVTEAGEKDEAVKNAGRAWFKKLEQGDPDARSRWQRMVDWSMQEFQRIYDILGVEFDIVKGESFYEPYLQDTIEAVKKSGISVESKGALIVDLKDKNLGVSIIQKSDGATVYMTRDLAGALYRQNEMHADGMIYVVGEDQKQYFEQLFETLRMMGEPIADKSVHVYFGMIRLPEGKMSTRKGRVVLLEEVIDEALKKTRGLIGVKTKLTDVAEQEQVIHQVAIGALKWNDLMSDPRRSIVFDWDKMLSTEGNSAPYVQYTHARAVSITEKAHDVDISTIEPTEEVEMTLTKQLASFPLIVRKAGDTHNPSVIASYLFELAQTYNKLYHDLSILGTEGRVKDTRVALTRATGQVIKNGLQLLGIEAPDRM